MARGRKHRDQLSFGARWRLAQRYARIKNGPPKKPFEPLKMFKACAIGMSIPIALAPVGVLIYPHVKVANMAPQGFEGQTLSGHAWGDDGVLRISADPGGGVMDRLAYAQWIKERGTSIEVLGICASACTYFLRNENVCAAPGSLWMFHRAQTSEDASVLAKTIGRLGINLLERKHGRSAFDQWMRDVESQMSLEDELWIVGEYLIEAGWVKECETEGFDVDKAREKAKKWSKNFVLLNFLPENK